jgi:demethoxyubiquinone hydroxylase (CLK1/Coq7/Cat5 family)
MQVATPDPEARRHLRVMHACEKGATGVYWGHRAVARVCFPDLVPELSVMHGHEVEHFAAFGRLMRARGVRTVIAPVFCAPAASSMGSSRLSRGAARSGGAPR